jgi:pyrroloquinoline quinone (PQQ) biosynthesis protein C
MILETEIRNTLDSLINKFIEESPFFSFWKTDRVTPPLSEKFLISFDSLVKSFPSLIAAGASRMEDETTRSILAVNLYQECGEGDAKRSHHAIYRKFIATAGIRLDAAAENEFATSWRKSLFEYINETKSAGAVLGALAAGEFLAQPALSRIYSVIKPHYPHADQEYFTKHLVLEEEHVNEITSIIIRQAKDDGGWEEIVAGFLFGLSVWESYFNSLAEFVWRAADPVIQKTARD